MPEKAQYLLGEYNGRKYWLTAAFHPDWHQPVTFMVTVHYRRLDPDTGETEQVEIARIENKAHGYAHIDQLWRDGDPKEPFYGDGYDAWEYLEENWETFAVRYDR